MFPLTTDSVLLGSWSSINTNKRILDLGTGSGILALMCAQRTEENCVVTAIDMDPVAVKAATLNFEQSIWHKKLTAFQVDIKEFCAVELFDSILCNPPYFISSLLPLNEQKEIQKHQKKVGFKDLAICFKRNIKDSGNVFVVIPSNLELELSYHMLSTGFTLKRICTVQDNADSKPSLVLLNYGFGIQKFKRETLILKNHSGSYTNQFISLTQDFYL